MDERAWFRACDVSPENIKVNIEMHLVDLVK